MKFTKIIPQADGLGSQANKLMIDTDAVCADGVDNLISMFGEIKVVNVGETNTNNTKLNVKKRSLKLRGAVIMINNNEIIPDCLVTLACDARGL